MITSKPFFFYYGQYVPQNLSQKVHISTLESTNPLFLKNRIFLYNPLVRYINLRFFQPAIFNHEANRSQAQSSV